MQKCLKCGYTLDAQTSLTGENSASKDGDISVCINCGYVSRFKDGKLTAMTDADISNLPVEVIAQISAIRQKLWAMRSYPAFGG